MKKYHEYPMPEYLTPLADNFPVCFYFKDDLARMRQLKGNQPFLSRDETDELKVLMWEMDAEELLEKSK